MAKQMFTCKKCGQTLPRSINRVIQSHRVFSLATPPEDWCGECVSVELERNQTEDRLAEAMYRRPPQCAIHSSVWWKFDYA